MHQIPAALNILDDVNLRQISALNQNCHHDHTRDIVKAKDSCMDIMNYIKAVSGDVFHYNAMVFDQDWLTVKQPYIDFLTSHSRIDDLFRAIHIDHSYKRPVWEGNNNGVKVAYGPDNLIDYTVYYNYLLEVNYPFIVMAGEFDS
jgi:hypothetical protein